LSDHDAVQILDTIDKIIAGNFSGVNPVDFNNPEYGEKLNKMLQVFTEVNNPVVMRLNETMGVYTKTCKVSDMIKTWVISYIGNFVGSFILGGLFVWSNASHQILVDYYRSFIYTKLDATPMELFIRGVLCNFLVCLAVYTGMKLKSESGKMIMMFCIITAFVLAGFEHCVANMGTFTIGYMLLGDIGTAAVIKSQFFVTLGNIVGGAVLLALPLKLMSAEH
jgi:nitrite transporter